MASSHLAFKTLNCPATLTPPSPTSASFTLTSSPPTDIWRKPGPPAIHTFNAPIIYKPIPLASFGRVRVTLSARWSALYEQGGLVFVLPSTSDSLGGSEDGKGMKWIKSGIEFYQGEPYVSTVAADRWADWSLVQAGLKTEKGKVGVTLEMERKRDDGTLWIYVVDGDKRIPIREVTWMLSEGDDRECWVGVYIANPTVSADGESPELVVDFTGWELDLV